MKRTNPITVSWRVLADLDRLSRWAERSGDSTQQKAIATLRKYADEVLYTLTPTHNPSKLNPPEMSDEEQEYLAELDNSNPKGK